MKNNLVYYFMHGLGRAGEGVPAHVRHLADGDLAPLFRRGNLPCGLLHVNLLV